MKQLIRAFIVALVVAMPAGYFMAGCANHPPPNVTPQAVAAWYGTQAIKDLDVVRDVAISANAVTPPVLSTDTTRKVVTWHETAIKVIHDVPNGWKAIVLDGLNVLYKSLSASEQVTLGPYIRMAQAALNEVVQ